MASRIEATTFTQVAPPMKNDAASATAAITTPSQIEPVPFINEVDCIDITSPTTPSTMTPRLMAVLLRGATSSANGVQASVHCMPLKYRWRGAPDGSGYQPAVAGWL